MKKEEKKVDFNLSILKLDELIKVYDEVNNFIKYCHVLAFILYCISEEQHKEGKT